MSGQWQVLYGTRDGAAWYVVRGETGRVPPARIGDVPVLGETSEVIRRILQYRLECARGLADTSPARAVRVRETFARELGIPVEQCGEYADDSATAELDSAGWGNLVRAHYFTGASVTV